MNQASATETHQQASTLNDSNPDTPQNQWVLASNNKGKLAEFTRLFAEANLDVTIVPQGQLDIDDAIEDGLSLVENAIIKARHASRASGLPAIADDSGLCVPALGNAPGIYSARYAASTAMTVKTMPSLSPTCSLSVQHSLMPLLKACLFAYWRWYVMPMTRYRLSPKVYGTARF